MQARVIIPVDPFQGFPFDVANGLPRAEELDDLGLEQADDAFGEGVVIGISDDAGLCEPLSVSDRQILAAPVAVMDQLVRLGGRRWQMAWFRASRTKPVVIEVETRQPTILRAKTSITKAT